MFKNARIISGTKSYIKNSNEIINNRVLVIKNINYTDFNSRLKYNNLPIINSRVILIERCCLDFLYFNLSPIMFPKVKLLFLNCNNIDVNFLSTWNKYSNKNFYGFVPKQYREELSRKNITNWYAIDSF